MKEFKINEKFKLWQSFLFLLLYILLLSSGYVTHDVNSLFGMVVIGAVILLIAYYIIVFRMRIFIYKDEYIQYKPYFGIWKRKINIHHINRIEMKKGMLFNHVVIYVKKGRITLYPQDATNFIIRLRFINKNIEYEE